MFQTLTVWTVACRQMTEGALQEHVVVAEDIQASLLDRWLYELVLRGYS
jgi:hypothetical protein